MKKALLLSGLLCAIMSCTKSVTVAPTPALGTVDSSDTNVVITPVDTSHTDTAVLSNNGFIKYTIPAGANYIIGNVYPVFSQQFLKFKVIFDSSCIYTNADPSNQADINKLYGFADCNTHHQVNSARFGWNWKDGKMHIHTYCYADAVRSYKELGTVTLNEEHTCSIEALPGRYIFTLDGKKDTMTRHCTDAAATGYKLLPYFGGDEPAPHEVDIRIKEMN